MSRSIVIAATVVASMLFASTSEAQIVVGGWGGVRVRAPFVSVNVGPYGYGGAYVRAPYTRYYGPAFPYRRPVVGFPFYPPIPPVAVVPAVPVVSAYRVPVIPVPVPAVPTVVYTEPAIPVDGYKVTRPSLDGYVSEDLRRAALRFQANLSVRSDADVWMNYLNPGRIVTSIDTGQPAGSLRDLVRNYDGVVANASLRPIYSMAGFNETRELLRVYVDANPSPATAAPRPSAAPRPAAPAPQPAPAPAPAAKANEDLPAPIPAPAADGDDGADKAPADVPPPPAAEPPGDAAKAKLDTSEELIDL